MYAGVTHRAEPLSMKATTEKQQDFSYFIVTTTKEAQIRNTKTYERHGNTSVIIMTDLEFMVYNT